MSLYQKAKEYAIAVWVADAKENGEEINVDNLIVYTLEDYVNEVLQSMGLENFPVQWINFNELIRETVADWNGGDSTRIFAYNDYKEEFYEIHNWDNEEEKDTIDTRITYDKDGKRIHEISDNGLTWVIQYLP